MPRTDSHSLFVKIAVSVGALIVTVFLFMLPRWIGTLPSVLSFSVTIVVVLMWLTLVWFAFRIWFKREA